MLGLRGAGHLGPQFHRLWMACWPRQGPEKVQGVLPNKNTACIILGFSLVLLLCCFHLKWTLGFSLKEWHLLLSLLHSAAPGLNVPTSEPRRTKPSRLVPGSREMLLGGSVPSTWKDPRSFRGNKRSMWSNLYSSDSAWPIGQQNTVHMKRLQHTYPNGLYSSLRISHGSTDSQLKSEFKTERWRKLIPRDLPNIFLSAYLYLQANVTLVPPSPWTLFCSTKNEVQGGRKHLWYPAIHKQFTFFCY